MPTCLQIEEGIAALRELGVTTDRIHLNTPGVCTAYGVYDLRHLLAHAYRAMRAAEESERKEAA